MPKDPEKQPSQDSPERTAVREALAGRGAAVGELFEAARPGLVRMVAFRMDARLRGRVDPDDVVQESFARVLGRLADYLERDMDFLVWLRLETSAVLIDLHRRHLGADRRDARRESPLFVDGVGEGSSIAIASAILDRLATPSRAAMKAEAGERLLAALETMKDLDREVLALRHFEQLANHEVARLLGLSPPAATLRYVRALRRLHELLADLELVSDVASFERSAREAD